jgi:hypothetical protein
MARTQDRRRSSATSRSEDSRTTRARPDPARLDAERAASPRRRSSVGPINKQLFIDGPKERGGRQPRMLSW